ncbi:hypothetical protein DAI22_03g147300 [Oryza sativa Japonica Group]|nr:hypothetical protein DAI22_03g147300 [Oryza sativa Japonica Group]
MTSSVHPHEVVDGERHLLGHDEVEEVGIDEVGGDGIKWDGSHVAVLAVAEGGDVGSVGHVNGAMSTSMKKHLALPMEWPPVRTTISAVGGAEGGAATGRGRLLSSRRWCPASLRPSL